jgi:hypothetical protein
MSGDSQAVPYGDLESSELERLTAFARKGSGTDLHAFNLADRGKKSETHALFSQRTQKTSTPRPFGTSYRGRSSPRDTFPGAHEVQELLVLSTGDICTGLEEYIAKINLDFYSGTQALDKTLAQLDAEREKRNMLFYLQGMRIREQQDKSQCNLISIHEANTIPKAELASPFVIKLIDTLESYKDCGGWKARWSRWETPAPELIDTSPTGQKSLFGNYP